MEVASIFNAVESTPHGLLENLLPWSFLIIFEVCEKDAHRGNPECGPVQHCVLYYFIHPSDFLNIRNHRINEAAEFYHLSVGILGIF